MRTYAILFFALISLIIPCGKAFCQDDPTPEPVKKLYSGYVITTVGYTINCEFKGEFFPDLKYKAIAIGSKEKFERINIAKIKEWFCSIDSAVYQALPIDSTGRVYRYFWRIEAGTLSLYERYDINHMNNVGFSMSKGNFAVGRLADFKTHPFYGQPDVIAQSRNNNPDALSAGYYVSKNNGMVNKLPANQKKIKVALSALMADNAALIADLSQEEDLTIDKIAIYIHRYNVSK